MKQIFVTFLLGFAVTLAVGLVVYPLLKKRKMGQVILHYVEEHKAKSGTPTMGGIMFILGVPAAFFMLYGFKSHYAVTAVAVMLAYGVVGFLDDFIKIKLKRNLGLKAYQKIVFQVLIAAIVSAYVYFSESAPQRIPFTDIVYDFGWGIIPLVAFIFLACTNSVNLTDGLDGLSSGTSLVYMVAFMAMIGYTAYMMLDNGMVLGNEYEALSLLCACMVGGLAAFLTFNAHPAKLFMGDTGSMALGGICASVAVFSGYSLFIPLVGIMFVFSSVSVILQVVSFKTRGKRIFRMAPFHHHLQEGGMSETRITVLYMTITAVVSAVAIALSF